MGQRKQRKSFAISLKNGRDVISLKPEKKEMVYYYVFIDNIITT